MTFKVDNNTAFCFKQDGKDGYSGTMTLDDGKTYWVNLYPKTGGKGQYMLAKLKEKQGRPVADNSRNTNPDIDSDTIPF